MSYGSLSHRRFLAWLRYDQYRKHLLLRRVYPCLVTSDITNFFDSILYDRLADTLHRIAASPRVVGLLYFLLERLSIRDPYSASPRIGLPVDEFDCSRALAHMVLLPHDDRVCALVGDDAYVRWMDDQLIGVSSRAEGLAVVSRVGESLARLHLTPNRSKTRILSLAAARRHFHLHVNGRLDVLEKMPCRSRTHRRVLLREVRVIWARAVRDEGVGEWSKILKRVYRLAGAARGRFLRRRATADLFGHPTIARRVCEYIRCTGTAREYLAFLQKLIANPEQVYPDITYTAIDVALRLPADQSVRSQLRRLAATLLAGGTRPAGIAQARTLAPLLILRYGDRRSLPALRSSMQRKPKGRVDQFMRAAGCVYASYGVKEFREVRRTAAMRFDEPLTTLVRLLNDIVAWNDVPQRFRSRLSLSYDAVACERFADVRTILSARLLALNRHPQVRRWLLDLRRSWLRSLTVPYEARLVARLLSP
jgi:ABC-type uncharacterized transport system YnjBCD ATPase subunit